MNYSRWIGLKSVVMGICQQCTVWSTFTIFHRNCWFIELWPWVVILWSWANEWRWSFHPYSSWQILPLHWYSPLAWLALKCISRTLFWCTMWSKFSLWRLRIGHVIWGNLVLITPAILCFIQELNFWWVRFIHKWNILRTSVWVVVEKIIKMSAVWFRGHVSNSWRCWWHVLMILFRVLVMISGVSIVCLFIVEIAYHALCTSSCNTNIHFHDLDVVILSWKVNKVTVYIISNWCK